MLAVLLGAAPLLCGQPPAHVIAVHAPTTLAEVIRDSAPGDVILLSAVALPYAGGVTLKDRQTLLGAGPEASAILKQLGIVEPSGLASGPAPIVSGEPITLTSDNTIAGIAFRPSRVAIAGGASGKTVITGIEISGGDTGVLLRNSRGRVTIERTTVKDMTGRAIALENVENVTLSNLTLSRTAGNNVASAVTCASDLVTGSTAGCNAAIDLRDARNVVLDTVLIDGSAQIGINGENVEGLTIRSSEVKRAGDESFESGMQFRNVTGDVVIRDTRVHDNASRQLYIANGKGELRLTIEGSSFANSQSPNGQQGLLLSLFGTARSRAVVRQTSFMSNAGNGLQVTTADHAQLELSIEKVTADRNAAGILIAAAGDSAINYTIQQSLLTFSSLGAITISALGPGKPTVSGTISGNVVGTSGASGSGGTCGSCHGIAIESAGGARARATVKDNIVQQIDGSAMRATAGGSSVLAIAATGNTFREPAGSNVEAIRMQAGTSKSDTATLCVDLGGAGPRKNTVTGKWSSESAILVRNRFAATTLRLVGYKGEGKDLAAISRFLGARNAGANARPLLGSGEVVNVFSAGDTCEVR